MLNNEARLFFSNWQGLGRHRGQRDTLNTVWQHPGQASWSCWARVQRLHMAHNPPRDRPPLPSSPAPPPSPPPSWGILVSEAPSFLFPQLPPFTISFKSMLQVSGLPACCSLCPTLLILVLRHRSPL